MTKINHEILSWARETAGLSVEEAAHKLHIKDGKTDTAEDKLLAYENNLAEPSRSMLLNMAKAYRRPILTFYLDKPPRIGDRGEDFRTLPYRLAGEENVYIDVLIRDIKARQSLIRQTLIDESEEFKLEFIGRSTVEQGVEYVTETLRKALKLDTDGFRKQRNYEDAFKILRHQAEKMGVFILLQGNLGSYHTNISVEAFRGFALADDIAPFIVINDRDAKSAWSFTLLHEMVHLLLGQTGISGAFAENKIEKFCNNVASEMLLPSIEFKRYHPAELDFVNIREEISNYAFSMKISSSHVAYRLYQRGDIDEDLWTKLSHYYQEQWKKQHDKEREKSKEQEGGPNYYVVRQYKLGALVALVQRFAYSGAISTTRAGILLNIRPLKVHRLFEVSQPI